jgi:hypothetical protein
MHATLAGTIQPLARYSWAIGLQVAPSYSVGFIVVSTGQMSKISKVTYIHVASMLIIRIGI